MGKSYKAPALCPTLVVGLPRRREPFYLAWRRPCCAWIRTAYTCLAVLVAVTCDEIASALIDGIAVA